MTNWKIINKKIKECQQLLVHEKVIDCLLDLFQQTNDGWVAFNIGQEYEKINKLEDALEYYQKAEELLPLPNYKEKARDAIRRVKNRLEEKKATKISVKELIDSLPDISNLDPSNTLFIVSCTPDKIWEYGPTAPDFVPARYAYKGKRFLKFLKWAEENEIEKKGFYWVVLSGKYGFVEPWHPISRYDVNLSNPNHYPISDETLRKQVSQRRWWRNKDGTLVEIKLADFTNIICVNCSSTYLNKIKMCFPQINLRNINMDSDEL